MEFLIIALILTAIGAILVKTAREIGKEEDPLAKDSSDKKI